MLRSLEQLPFGNQRSFHFQTTSEFVEAARRVNRPVADASFESEGAFVARMSALQIGDLGLSALSTGPCFIACSSEQHIDFSTLIQGNGKHTDNRSSVSWQAPKAILQVSHRSPVGITADHLTVAVIRPQFDKLVRVIETHAPQLDNVKDRLLTSGIVASPGECNGINYYDGLRDLYSIIDNCNCDEGFLAKIGMDDIFYRMLAQFTVAQFGHTVSSPTPSRLPRSRRAVDMICDHIRQNIGQPLTIPRMEDMSGLTGRALNYAFRSRFNCSPQEWQRSLLLDEAYRRLKSGAPQISIKGLSNELGFSSASSFSAHYKERHGELPSETVSRSRPLATRSTPPDT